MLFYIRPVWDDEAKVYISASNIIGLNIEAETADEIYEIAKDCAVDLIIANHLSDLDILNNPIKDLIPFIHFQSEDKETQLQAMWLMPIGFYKDIIAFFKKNGFSYLRNSKGSYEVWGNSDGLSMIIPKNTKSRHTADKIMQAAGINHKF